MSTLLPHQQRVVEEKADLDARIARLRAFVGCNTFASRFVSGSIRRTHRSSAVGLMFLLGINLLLQLCDVALHRPNW